MLETIGLDGNDFGADGNPVANFNHAAFNIFCADCDRFTLNETVLDGEYKGLTAFFNKRCKRQRIDRTAARRGERAVSKHATFQCAVEIRQAHKNGNRTRARFSRGINALHLAFEFATRKAVYGESNFLAHFYTGNIADRNRCFELHLRQIHDMHHRCIGGNFFAHVHRPLGHNPCKRCANLCIGQGTLGNGGLGHRGLVIGFRNLHTIGDAVEGVL